ncbi:MAG: TIM barrel protein, partial [Candidatus Thermoplasmatota archaeon]|nr:TIM barrel protein [Candidatus Thermoplasmatota archaeon]
MKLLFGPAGIPLSCKGRTILDGIIDTRKLGLDVMEIELLRVDADIGDIDKIKKASREHNVRLFMHAPYYINLSGNKAEVEKYLNIIKESGVLASHLGAEILIVHLGMYHTNKKESMENIVSNIRRLRDSFSDRGLKCRIGIETSGKQGLFGTIDEIVTVCKRVKGIIPVINFAHIHARGNGCLKTKEDFQQIFDKLKPLNIRSYYTHFSGVVYENGNEIDLTPIKKSNLKFDPFAECILKNKYNITIISASPLLEHDAIYMKLILDRVNEKISKKKPEIKKVEKKPEKAAVKKPEKVVKKKKIAKKKPVELKKHKKAVKKTMKRKIGEKMKPKKAVKKKPKKIKKPKNVLKKKIIIKKKREYEKR